MDWGSFKLAKRGAMVCAVAFACAVAPAVAADDPLLSGYSGPGGGEQVVIGSSVIPPKNGNGSIRSGSGGQTASAQPQSSSKSAGGKSAGKSGDRSSSQQKSPAAVIAAKPSYPNDVSSASSLPLSGGDMAMIAGVALIAALLAFAAMRLRGSQA